jgi:hypothetical protein
MTMSAAVLRRILDRMGEDTGGTKPALERRLDAAVGRARAASAVDVTCPVCLDPIAPPIYQCTAGHLICGPCNDRCEKCPTCRVRLTNCRARALEDVIRHRTVECSNGCGETVELGSLVAHRAECTSGLRCVHCDWVGSAAELARHFHDRHLDSTCKQSTTSTLPLALKEGVLDASLDWLFEEGAYEVILVIRHTGNELSICPVSLGQDVQWTLTLGRHIVVSGLSHPASVLKDGFDPHALATVRVPAAAVTRVLDDGTLHLQFTVAPPAKRCRKETVKVY